MWDGMPAVCACCGRNVVLWIEPEDQLITRPTFRSFAVSDVNGKPGNCLLPQKLPSLCFASE